MTTSRTGTRASWKLVRDSVSLDERLHLSAITSLSATDLWVVGFASLAAGHDTTYAEHFDGTSWSMVSTPSPVTSRVLLGVSSATSGHVYAVGYTRPNDFTVKTLVLKNGNG